MLKREPGRTIGRGRRLFEHVSDQRPLQLVRSQQSAAGVLELTYRPGLVDVPREVVSG
jgi:hypothetical protein